MQDTTMNDDERFRKISALKGSRCKLFHTSANSQMGVRSGPLLVAASKRVWDCDEPVSLMVPVPLD